MNANLKNCLVKPKKRTGAKLKGTVATIASLCIVCTVFFASLLAGGCNQKVESSNIDDRSFFEKINDAPVALVSRGELPVWLNKIVEIYEVGGELGIPSPARFYRGIWNGRVTYFISCLYHNCPFCYVFDGNGNNIVWTGDGDDVTKFCSISKDWVLIYQTGNQEFFQ